MDFELVEPVLVENRQDKYIVITLKTDEELTEFISRYNKTVNSVENLRPSVELTNTGSYDVWKQVGIELNNRGITE